MKCEDMGHEWCSNKSDSKYLWGGGGGGIMGVINIRMQQNVGTYWILSIGELHSSIFFCIVEYANPFMSKYTSCIL
jgi:predicted Rossmann-fold nucleotide-binding protein